MTVALAAGSSPAITSARRFGVPAGLAVGRQLRGVDVIERLDDLRRRQVRLQQLGGRRRLVVELGDVAVTLRVVVVGVDDDLARERLDRHRPVVLQRNRDDDDVAGLRGVDGACRARLRPELGDERGERLRPARIADHDVVAVCHRQSRDLAADVPGADESDGSHDDHYIAWGSITTPDGAR